MLETVAKDLGAAILVRHIMTPIALVRAVHADDPVDSILERMHRKNFHATTVLRDGQVSGWVSSSDLAGQPGQSVGSVRREVTTDVVISAGATITSLLERFPTSNFLLVVGETGIEGIVTPSDLGRQAGRMHLFVQICALELAVAALARKQDDLDSTFDRALTAKDRSSIRSRLARRVESDEVADKVAVLYFLDLLKIGKVLIPGWRDVDLTQLFELNRFRNTIVHAPNEVADDGSVTIHSVVANLDLVRRLLAQI